MYDNAYRPPTQFSVFPPVIKNLLIINGLVYFAQMVPTTANLLVYWFALWPLGTPAAPGFWPWQLVSYGFLHGGLGHLFFNMFALWMFGAQLENCVG
jgi:membrane associated rhomboid family serine protease